MAVVDESGRLVTAHRGDGASFASPDTARAKAVLAATFKFATITLAEYRENASAFWRGVLPVLSGELLPGPGGFPITADGRMIGAIGCGGAKDGYLDHQCADASAQAVSTSDPSSRQSRSHDERLTQPHHHLTPKRRTVTEAPRLPTRVGRPDPLLTLPVADTANNVSLD